jgi:hypothetical protein
MILMLLSGAWGKVIHEKNLKQKSRDTVPLSSRQDCGPHSSDRENLKPPMNRIFILVK